MGLCGACKSNYTDGAYRCLACRRICNYRNFFFSWRGIVFALILPLLLMTGLSGLYWIKQYGFILPRLANPDSYESIKVGDVVLKKIMLRHLKLDDPLWNCDEPLKKGKRLHLWYDKIPNKHVMVFVPGWGGDYISTWGDVQMILNDDRFNRTYDFVFWGYKFGKKLKTVANELNQLLDEMELNYQTVTLVTHSKGGLVAMRALLDRHDKWPKQEAHRIHKIVMFAPPTENLVLDRPLPESMDYKASRPTESKTIKSEIANMQQTIQNIMDTKNDSGDRGRFSKTILDKLTVVHGAEDKIVDWVNGVKTVFNPLRQAGRFSEGGLSYIVVPEANHRTLVKMGQQKNIPMVYRFDVLLWKQVGRPPGTGMTDREQVVRSIGEWVEKRLYDLNKMVISDPELGHNWHAIDQAFLHASTTKTQTSPIYPVTAMRQTYNGSNQAANAAARDGVLARVGKDHTIPTGQVRIKNMYYIYLFLDIYARMDAFREQGLLREFESPLREWRTDWIPDLMRSETGKWMIQKNLLDYYSDDVKSQIEQATRFTSKDLTDFVNEAIHLIQDVGTQTAEGLLCEEGSRWRFGDTYLFGIDTANNISSVATFWFHPVNPKWKGKKIIKIDHLDFLTTALKMVKDRKRDSAWMLYRWCRPNARPILTGCKISYIQRVKKVQNTLRLAKPEHNLYVGSGVYEMKVDENILREVVNQAALLVEEEGVGKAIEEITNPSGAFVNDHVYLFVLYEVEKKVEIKIWAPNAQGTNTSRAMDLPSLDVETLRKAVHRGEDGVVMLNTALTVWSVLPAPVYLKRVQCPNSGEEVIVGAGLH